MDESECHYYERVVTIVGATVVMIGLTISACVNHNGYSGSTPVAAESPK